MLRTQKDIRYPVAAICLWHIIIWLFFRSAYLSIVSPIYNTCLIPHGILFNQLFCFKLGSRYFDEYLKSLVYL